MQNRKPSRLLFLSLVIFFLFLFTSTNSLSLTPVVITANYSHQYEFSLNSTVEYVFLYSNTGINKSDGARIIVESDNAISTYPLIVVVRQKKGILSWQIPLQVEGRNTNNPISYHITSRTLCPNEFYKSIKFDKEPDQYVTISISTASIKNISFNLQLFPLAEFYLKSGDEKSVNITPSQPVYYGYNYDGLAESSSVLVSVESDSETCMTFSIQNTSCPVFDLERNIQFAGYWETVSYRGGITVPKERYPNGFFIVFVVNADDTECSPKSSINEPNRTKYVKVKIVNSITRHNFIIATFSTVAVFVSFCVIYIIGAVSCRVHHNRALRRQNYLEEADRIQESARSPEAHTSGFQEIGEGASIAFEEDSSLDEDDIDLMEDALSDKEIIRTKMVLSVCDLARKEPRILRKKSRLYIHYLITIAIFYTAPVLQLVVTYQNVLHVTGNQDLCYYNFLCAHPLYFLSDFNHVFSNLGYILLGLLFIFIVSMRERYDESCIIDRGNGIPQHYGLYYAMGFALMMEGVLSGSYHLCPNHSNFQFDTSFMYIIAVLCMVKIYQNRHPDINAKAPVTFGVLAITIVLALIGVLDDGVMYYWIFFTVIHLCICLSLSAQIYYMGRWKFNMGVFRRMIMTMKHDARAGVRYLVRPLYWRRLLLLVLGNLCNLAIAIYGNKHYDQDFATYLLMILMSNLLLYTFFYIVMKLINGERILLQPGMYILLASVTWGGALYFFINKSITWAKSPAKSRVFNRPCLLYNFYDYHDIWHFLSALAMFFSFMVLLTLDDDLADSHRSLIPVF
ncbi:SID1 transmembrane family member 1-like [Trichogramma pretiosum]|uniref:SID1 transmembrane family member 1-like n=1 Tax=Trichogramma pretiosum TaxID=7493 RepID=UPI0006C97158|nr:SID1 transmembrane family member 1-like [Trichogramma pretiosum]